MGEMQYIYYSCLVHLIPLGQPASPDKNTKGLPARFCKSGTDVASHLKSDLDFSATACPTDTFAAMSGRGRGSRGRGDRGGYESRGRGGGRGRGDGLGFRGGRGGGRGGEVADTGSVFQSLITFAIRLPMHQPSQNHRAPCTSGTRYRAARSKHALAGAYEANGQIGEAVGIRVDKPD